MKPLAIIPTYLTEEGDVQVAATAISSLRETVGDACDVLVIDDGSPHAEFSEGLAAIAMTFDCETNLRKVNVGFSQTVNIGLRQALQEGRDAILVNADIEFTTKTWLDLMLKQRAMDGERMASIVGARLIYPNGLLQHCGIYFSLLGRTFGHSHQHAPANLPEALHARECPVTGALQFIRHECLEGIGVYDEDFSMGFEDVDYCIRTWQSGRSIVYQPGVEAIHHESYFRGRQNEKVARWQAASWLHFARKHANTSFAEFVPSLV